MKKTFFISLIALLLVAGVAQANNSWGKYHWNISTAESIASPLVLGDNLTTSLWGTALSGASLDWNASVLKNQVIAGSNTACDPTLGGVEICNAEYGNNGWLGIAQVWVYRGRDGHIAQGLVKVNDTYFNTTQFNTEPWRNLVMCQEVGHTFGLGHQDEDFDNANIGTCMDYTSDPDGTLSGQLDNQHPNGHDYDMMTDKYAHLNEVEKVKGGGGNGKGNGKSGGSKKEKSAGVGASIDLNDPSSWGRAIKQDARGNDSVFERDLGNGQILITYVTWIK